MYSMTSVRKREKQCSFRHKKTPYKQRKDAICKGLTIGSPSWTRTNDPAVNSFIMVSLL